MASPRAHVLFVCTGNQCRSVMAERLLARALARRGAPATVASAGLAPPGAPPPAETLEVLRRRGIDATDHRSRGVDAALVRSSGLVLGMERAHVREAAVLDPSAWPRTFTLMDLVRRGAAIGPRQPRESPGAWLGRAGQGRRLTDVLGASVDDDIPDPMGAPLAAHEQAAGIIEWHVERVAALLWPGPVAPTG